MPLAQVRSPGHRQPLWHQWWRIPVLGCLLGLLQGLLVLSWGWLAPWPFAWIALLVLSVFCALAIPALAGFLAKRAHADPSASFPPGFLVGGIGFLISLVALWSGLLPLPSLACPKASCQGWGFGMGGILVLLFLGAVWLLEALFAGPLGGWIGGLLGQRHAARQRSKTPKGADD